MAVVGQLSAVWPPGPSHVSIFFLSSALLVAAGGLAGLACLARPSLWVVASGAYIFSVALLEVSTGGIRSGLGSLMFVPVVGAALYWRRWQSAAVLGQVIVALLYESLAGPHMADTTVRRVVLFGLIAAVLSVSIHALRERLVQSNAHTTRLLHQAEALNAAAQELAALLDPGAIMSLGVQLAARLASPPGSQQCEAWYLTVKQGKVRVDARFGAPANEVWDGRNLGSCKPLERAVEDGQPVVGLLVPEESAAVTSAETHAVWVPVRLDGTLHGVLCVASRDLPIPLDCLQRCIALAHLLELALSNWAAHQRLEQHATTEERRRIARELHDGLAHELAFIASKARAGGAVGCAETRELACAADRALDEARRAITVLSASRPERLSHALAQTAEDLGARLGVAVKVELAEDVEMPGEVTENLLRIVREAITNAANHGHPSHVTVRLQHHDGVRLLVEDDGCGFDTINDPRAGGFGLLSMQERATSIGAHFSVESKRSQGTRVQVAFR